tara:strand:+ start:3893 stop:4156 length:264 start_codon:yes stop_codon:yes gene_type:complete
MIENVLTKYLGFIAGIFTTIAFLPQVIKVWKTKSTSDISLAMFIIFTTGITFWLAYGIIIDNLALIIANSITLLLSISILIAKILFK